MAAGLQEVITIGKTARGVRARSGMRAALTVPILSKRTRTPIITLQTINLAFILINVTFYQCSDDFKLYY